MKTEEHGKAVWQPDVRGIIVIICAALLFPLTACAQTKGRQVLHGNVPAVAAQLSPLGKLPGASQLNLAIGLPLRNKEALTNLLREIYDPASTNFVTFSN
jgi:hypothetical protein